MYDLDVARAKTDVSAIEPLVEGIRMRLVDVAFLKVGVQ